MWISLDESASIEFGYMVCYDRIEMINNKFLYDEDGNQCYTVHSDGWNFPETGDPGTFEITPLELAGMIQGHDEYDGGSIRLLACYAGAYEKGAAYEVASYLGVPVIAAIQSVYVDYEHERFLSLPSGLSPSDLQQMENSGDSMLTDRYQEA